MSVSSASNLVVMMSITGGQGVLGMSLDDNGVASKYFFSPSHKNTRVDVDLE